MAFSTQRKLFTIEEYHKMADVGILAPGDRYELIKGEIIKMTPIKSTHAGFVNFLLEHLIVTLHQKYTVIGKNPVHLSPYSEPEPDIVVAHYREDRYRSAHPSPADILLIIEVADSTLDYDRGVKKALYAEAGIPEYWIVNIPEKQVESYCQPERSTYKKQQTYVPPQKATSISIDFVLELKDLFKK